MASQHSVYRDDWASMSAPTSSTPATREPRDERARIPHSHGRRALRPKALNTLLGSPIRNEESETFKNPGRDFLSVEDSSTTYRAAEFASATAWPVRDLRPANNVHRKQAPSVSSQYSIRQSDISFGILDYYIRNPSPPPPTSQVDPAIEQFDFGLAPTAGEAETNVSSQDGLETMLGAERPEQPLVSPVKSTPPAVKSQETRQKRYGLFPTIPETPTILLGTEADSYPDAASLPPYPPSTRRARKESLPLRPRTDSLPSRPRTSSLPSIQRCPPARAPSGRSTSSNYGTHMSVSTCATSPPGQNLTSRWSEDTIILSPATTVTPGGGRAPRTSFGSLLGAQFPASVFEEDEECQRGLLRKKWLGKGRKGETEVAEIEMVSVRRGSEGVEVRPRRSTGGKIARAFVCGSCWRD